MKVGLAAGLRVHPKMPRPLTEIYQDYIAECVLGDELGFSHAWLSEHHFAEDDWNTSPLTILAAVSSRTERIRLGTYVLLLALHNPLRVAEEMAAVDILSNGRLDIAVGAGPMPQECEVFGIDKKETFARTYEALHFIQRCFTEDTVTHEGKYYQFRNVQLRPKSVQKPHPPIWMAAMGPQSIARTAERGYNLASALHSPLWTTYPDLLAKNGRRREDHQIVSGPVFIHIAESREKAWDEAEEGFHWGVEFYRRRGVEIPLPPVGELRRTPDAGVYGVPFIIGTVDDAMKGIGVYRDTPMEQIALQFSAPGMDPEHVARAMRLFAKEIMPEVNSWGAVPA